MALAEPMLVASGFGLPEAPVWFDDRLWCSDVLAGGVHVMAWPPAEQGATGTVAGAFRDVLLPGRKGIGGMVLREGRLVATGRDLVDATNGETLVNRPAWATGLNDLELAPDGSLLVGVLTFRPFAGETAEPGYVARIFPAEPARNDWQWREGVRWPNGIAATADGTFFVADFADGRLLRGTLLSRGLEQVAVSPSGAYDGMDIDDRGRLWLATGPGASVECRSQSGGLLHTIALPAQFASSVCVGGRNRDTLFITTSASTSTGDGAVFACPLP